MIRRRILHVLLLALILSACNLPVSRALVTTEVASLPTPVPDAPLGTEENPIVMALKPSATGEAVENAQAVAVQLSELSGLVVVTTTTASYTDLVESLGTGQVHLAWLPPFPYLLAHEKGYADVILTTTVNGTDKVGTQFLVNARRVGVDGYKVYFNPATRSNIADAATALAQFNGEKPCWTDSFSPSGYVLPLGLLAENGIETKIGAFLQGEIAVIGSLSLDAEGGVCDFGAIRADGQSLLEADPPNVEERTVVVWVSEPIIPYDAVAFASSLPADVRIGLAAALLTMSQSKESLPILRAAFGYESLKYADDSLYDDLRAYLGFSGLNLSALVR